MEFSRISKSSEESKDKVARPVDCRRCVHFSVTWQEPYRYACRAFQMKTRNLPIYHVRKESAMDCLYYQEKKFKKRNSRDEK